MKGKPYLVATREVKLGIYLWVGHAVFQISDSQTLGARKYQTFSPRLSCS